MYRRIVVGLVAVAALLMIVMLDAFIADRSSHWNVLPDLLRRGSVIPILFTTVAIAAAHELSALMRRVGCRPFSGLAGIWVAVLMLSPWLCAGRILGDAPGDVEGFRWQLIWLACALVTIALAQLRRGFSSSTFADIGATTFVLIYLGFLPAFFVMLRCSGDVADPHDGAWYVLIVLAIAFSTDVGALFGGKLFGRRPLAPSISPKKTVEGALAGVAASVLFSFILYVLARISGPVDLESLSLGFRVEWLAHRITGVFDRMTLFQVGFLGVSLSILVQVGDLFESALKRSAQVKDSSTVIPGMGGVLDVIDGVLVAAPGAWLLLFYVWELV